MGYDGWVTVATALDTKQLEKDLKDAERRLKQFEKEGERLAKAKVKAEVDLQPYEEQKRMISEMTDEANKFAQNEQEVANNLNLEKMQLEELNNKYSKQITNLDNINKKIKENARNQQLVTNEVEETNQKLRKAQGISGITEAIKNAGKETSNTIKKVGKWALAVFGVRSAYMLVRNAASTLSQYNDQIGADLEYMRFALASALQPVVEYLIQLAYKLLRYIGYIAQAWFGVNIFANASADAMNKTAKDAKELRKALAGFDEMNIVSGGASNASAGNTTLPSVDLTKPEEGEIPSWVQWIADNGQTVADALVGIATGLGLVKLGVDPLMSLGIGALLFSTLELIKEILEYVDKLDPALEDNGTSWGDLSEILGWVGIVLGILGGLIASIPVAIAAAIVAAIALLMSFWDTLEGWLDTAIDWLTDKAEWFSDKGDLIVSTFLTIVAGIVDTIKTVFGGLFTSIKNIVDGILLIFKGDFKNGFIEIGKGIANAFITILNTAISLINTVWTGLLNIIDTAGGWFGQKWNLSANLKIPKIPYLEVGGIVNMPGRGTFYGGAMISESGPEGVIPLTNEQMMERLGESIGKHVAVNTTVVNKMNSRVISREMHRTNNIDNFAYNG